MTHSELNSFLEYKQNHKNMTREEIAEMIILKADLTEKILQIEDIEMSTILLLRYCQGKTMNEIGEMLNLHYSAVSKKISDFIARSEKEKRAAAAALNVR